MTRFPHELLVLGLPAQDRERAVHAVIGHVVGLTDVSVVDALVVVTSAGEVTDTVEIIGTAYDPGLAAPTPGVIGEADIAEIGSVLPPDGSALALLVEHVWATRLAAGLETVRGQWVASVPVPTADVRAAQSAVAGRDHSGPGMRGDTDRGAGRARTAGGPGHDIAGWAP